jgi:hypothetical protein
VKSNPESSDKSNSNNTNNENEKNHKHQILADPGNLAALAEHDLAGLSAVINSDKPVKSPPGCSDAASTTITMKFGDKEIVANFNDGVEVNEATSQLRQRLLTIGAALRGVAKN